MTVRVARDGIDEGYTLHWHGETFFPLCQTPPIDPGILQVTTRIIFIYLSALTRPSNYKVSILLGNNAIVNKAICQMFLAAVHKNF